jgi:hypothetical protein
VDKQTSWEKAAIADGTTESERLLSKLARKAFLSLWSFVNVYTDEGRRNGRGDGKELCDLLVVFGNNVLIFSDKHCAFKETEDIKVAWRRWYKRAIEKSARQLAGAEKFIKAFPLRIFLDKQCVDPIPLSLPDPISARYFLIAVTRGSYQASEKYFGSGSSGSLIIETHLQEEAHYEAPFRVGYPLPNRRFVHILDEMTLEFLLEELDTVPDLVEYLACKEKYLSQPGINFSVSGEEELITKYMLTIEEETHTLPVVPLGCDFAIIQEGDWKPYVQSRQRAAKKSADEISYLWDSLIEYQSSFIRAGTAVSILSKQGEVTNHERVARALAGETRLARRALSHGLKYALSQNVMGRIFSRIFIAGASLSRAFVFLTAPKPLDMAYEDYRAARFHSMMTYCMGLKSRFSNLTEAIAIGSEPFTEIGAETSYDFLYVDLLKDMEGSEKVLWEQEVKDLGILRASSEIHMTYGRAREFPMPFNFDSSIASTKSENTKQTWRRPSIGRRRKNKKNP